MTIEYPIKNEGKVVGSVKPIEIVKVEKSASQTMEKPRVVVVEEVK